MGKYYTTTEVMEMYNVTRATLLGYINKGLFGIVRKMPGRNGQFRISEKNLEEFENNLLP